MVFGLLQVCLLLLLKSASAAKKNKDVYCGACVAIIDEMDLMINEVDPKKKVDVGSFRVDPKGNQALKSVPLARSELQVTEFMEGVCSKMSSYAETTDGTDGKSTFIRTSSRDGVRVSLKNARTGTDLAKSLKYACENIREDEEETLIEMFKNAESNMREKVCIEITGYCDKEDIDRMKAAYSNAVAEALLEEQQRNLEESNAAVKDDEDDEEEDEGEEMETQKATEEENVEETVGEKVEL